MTKTWVGASPANYAVGRSGYTVQYIFLHWIVGHLSAADATFQDPNRIASAHYGVENDQVHQYVDEGNVAFHAGAGDWNWKSIGIEHAGGPDIPVTESTIQTSALLVADICRRYSIPCDRTHIKKHNEVKQTTCPGTLPVDRIVELAQHHLSGSTGEGDDVTTKDHITYEVQDIADVIGGDPHYDETQPDAFNGHVDRALTAGGLELRAIMRDFLRDGGWKNDAEVQALERDRDTFAKSDSANKGETLRLTSVIKQKDDQIVEYKTDIAAADFLTDQANAERDEARAALKAAQNGSTSPTGPLSVGDAFSALIDAIVRRLKEVK